MNNNDSRNWLQSKDEQGFFYGQYKHGRGQLDINDYQISPVRKNEGETICSLNFAQRIRNVKLGAAIRKLENGDVTEILPCSPSRTLGTPQRGIGALKPSIPSSGSKLTPSRQIKKK